MKVGLIRCPAFGPQWAPLNLAILSSHLRTHKIPSMVFDFNIDLYADASKEMRTKYWSMSNHHFWDNPDMNELISDELIDLWIDQIIESDCTVVGLSIYSSNYQISLIFAEKLKLKSDSIKIIFGGPFCRDDHGTIEEILKTKNVDAVVAGEAEDGLLELLEFYKENYKFNAIPGTFIINEKNDIIEGDARKTTKDLTKNIIPDFRDFDLSKYDGFALPILSSRSCIYNCAFCNERTYWGRYRSRGAKSVYNEMVYQSKIYGMKEFVFCDLALNGDIKLLEELSDLIINSGREFSWRGYLLVRKMPRELIFKMAKAGFKQHCVGIETGSPAMLKLMNKNFKIEAAEQMLKNLHEAGIETHTSWIVGYPGETNEHFLETVDFVKRNRKYMNRVNPANVLNIPPGSPIAINPEKFGVTEIINSLEWSDETSTAQEKQDRASYFNNLFCSDELRTFEKIKF